ncbi:hypothetical protein HGP28_09045 [Vibrio sp. SM6]|uniref:Uncharacterized protein n=1 Tax=Vibrio agarilyticus TaxID=2726741 RepID=A0A7X8TRT1_9VIBR|nr:hypothetical protein [Vibrio agarilyticus]NLS13033.1 hypothetical protein [Vibrio agarilyticus]
MNRCGQCRQFTRMPNQVKDLCGAWQQPTLADRAACELFLAKSASKRLNNGLPPLRRIEDE